MAVLTIPDPIIKIDWRGLRLAVFQISVASAGGHEPKEALRMSKVRGGLACKLTTATTQMARVMPNSLAASDDNNSRGDAFCSSGSGTQTMRFLLVGEAGPA